MMDRQLVIAVVGGMGGMLGWGVADFFAKKTIDSLGDIATLFWSQCAGTIPLMIIVSMHHEFPKLYRADWFWLAGLGVWSGLSYIPTYVAFGKGKVSLLSPIFAAYAVVVSVASALLFHEAIPPGRQVAYAIVFVGILLVTGGVQELFSLVGVRSGKKRTEIAGLKEILTAVALYSLWLLALDRFLKGRDWLPFLLTIRLFSAIALLGYARVAQRSLAVVDRRLWKYLGLVGLFDVAAFASVSFGFSCSTHTSVVAMLSAAFSLPTIILARVFLKERASGIQHIGSLAVVAGVVLIYLL